MKAKLLSTAAAVLMLLLIAAALPLSLPRLFGIQIYSILTPSMAPALPVGSAIYVAPCDPAALQTGDMVTFALSEGTGLVETHRVVQNNVEEQQLVTQGDANAEADVAPVRYSRVVGKVIFDIPALGALSTALHTMAGTLGCIGLFVLAFVLWTLADQYKKRENCK